MAPIEAATHLDPTAEITLENVKKRAVSSVLTLTIRNFVIQTIGFLGLIAFTILLKESEIGVYWIISAIINFMSFFAHIGLAAALIQKREKPEELDLKTTFTIQQSMVIILLLLLWLLSPLLKQFYNLNDTSLMLLYALGFSLLTSSLKTIPSVLLERKLQFTRLIIPEITEVALMNGIAVFLAWQGYGLTSYTVAILTKSTVGLILTYILQPWKPGFAFSIESLRNLFKFGIPYQLNNLLAILKDDGLTMFLGGILGAQGIGLLGWAQRWATAPLRFFMDMVIKVTFPAYSRMQDDKQELSKAVSYSVFFICFLVFPALVGLLSLAPTLTEIIPRYEKWKPALLALGLCGINTAFAAVTTPLTNLLNATGKIKTTFRLMIMWTVLTWLIIPLSAANFGVTGAALGYAIVGSSSVVAIWIVYKNVKFDLLSAVGKPFVSAILMGVFLNSLKNILSPTISTIIVLVFFGVLSYGFLTFILLGPKLILDTKKVWYAIIKS